MNAAFKNIECGIHDYIDKQNVNMKFVFEVKHNKHNLGDCPTKPRRPRLSHKGRNVIPCHLFEETSSVT